MPERSEELLDLTRMLIELGDRNQASKNLTASLFALACLSHVTPRELTDVVFKGVPDDDTWESRVLPELLDYPDDYEALS